RRPLEQPGERHAVGQGDGGGHGRGPQRQPERRRHVAGPQDRRDPAPWRPYDEADERQQQERERDEAGSEQRNGGAVRRPAALSPTRPLRGADHRSGSGTAPVGQGDSKPSLISTAWPSADTTNATNACAADTFGALVS